MRHFSPPQASADLLATHIASYIAFNNSCAVMSAFDTVWPADSVEYCPHPSYHNLFACGTYKLEQSELQNNADSLEDEETLLPAARPKQKRRGECLLFQVDDGDEPSLYA